CHIPGCKSPNSFENLHMQTAIRILHRTILAAIFGLLCPNGERGAADLYETAAPGWERGRLGSYRGALGLRWDGSAGYWIRRGVGRLARNRRAQCWTADRVCTAFSRRNVPPEESRPTCVARARGELGDGVFFQNFGGGVGATGINEPPRFFRRAFSLRPRFARRALCGRSISVSEAERSHLKVCDYAHLPS